MHLCHLMSSLMWPDYTQRLSHWDCYAQGEGWIEGPCNSVMYCDAAATVFQNPTLKFQLDFIDFHQFGSPSVQDLCIAAFLIAAMQAALKREERKRLDEQLDFEVQLVGRTQNYNLPGTAIHCGVLCTVSVSWCCVKPSGFHTAPCLCFHPARLHAHFIRMTSTWVLAGMASTQSSAKFLRILSSEYSASKCAAELSSCHVPRAEAMKVQNENSQIPSQLSWASDLGAHCSDWWGGSGPKAQQSQNSQEQGGIGSWKAHKLTRLQVELHPICFRMISVASAWCDKCKFPIVSLPQCQKSAAVFMSCSQFTYVI